MGRKCNTKHPYRAASRYKDRLRKRGMTRTPEMEALSTLRKRQKALTDQDWERAGWNYDEFGEVAV